MIKSTKTSVFFHSILRWVTFCWLGWINAFKKFYWTIAFQETETGLFVSVNSFFGFGKDYVDLYQRKTGHSVFLHILRERHEVFIVELVFCFSFFYIVFIGCYSTPGRWARKENYEVSNRRRRWFWSRFRTEEIWICWEVQYRHSSRVCHDTMAKFWFTWSRKYLVLNDYFLAVKILKATIYFIRSKI